MFEYLKSNFNQTTTDNGAFAYKSTKSDVLDLFAQGGAYRNKSDEEVVALFSKAFSENPTLALRTLFYLRDIRGGQGERRFFKVCLKHLAKNNPKSLRKNLHYISTYGRWDDMWVLLDTQLKNDVIKLVKKQLKLDVASENPSMLAKWMPSLNASSITTKKYGKVIQTSLGVSEKKYRQILSELRKRINILETHITNKAYEKIEYDKIPSIAGMKYRQAFFRNDEERYADFLDKLSTGEVKVNSKTLFPNSIVGKILIQHGAYYGINNLTENEIKLFEGQWRNLPDYIGENHDNSLVMADVSGSMLGTPMDVSISLALYIAERNRGIYKDYFMTFSSHPDLVKIKGTNIAEKVHNISKANWDMSTNIEKALQTILDVAINNKINPEEMVTKLIIISDMQWDSCTKGADIHIFKYLKKEFEEYGYTFPQLIFWNVKASSKNVPFTMNDSGVALVSGFSPSILTNVLGDKVLNPYELMLDVVNSERYSQISA